MKDSRVSRRFVVGALGVGAVGAAGASVLAAGSPSAGSRARADVAALLEPLGPGTELGPWRVERVHPAEEGALSVVLSDANGGRFQLDVCRRDGEARGPARTDLYDVFLANEGDGATRTHESHGLAAMALAEVIRANEHRVEAAGLTTLRERVAARRVRRHLT
jgi:hypothetical protein